MPTRRVLLGVSLVCAANLLLEVSLTRIFSALMFYHFTFFAIALALLGMGASGVYVYVRSDRFPAEKVDADMARFSRWFAFTTVVALAYVLANPVVVYNEMSTAPTRLTNISLLQLMLLCGASAAPFFFAGMVVSLAVAHYRKAIDRVYFFDLAGAGVAALVVGLVIRALGGPGLVVSVGVLACGAAVLFSPGWRTWAALAAALLMLGVSQFTTLFNPPGTKMVKAERVEWDAWNTFSHVTLENMGGGKYDIRIDSSARTPVMRIEDASSPEWRTDISSFAYHVHDGGPEQVLIIGPGGGIDVAHALSAGSKHVTGVELNPLIGGEIMRGRHKELSHGLYFDPRVHLVVDEGRSFVRRSSQRFDVIQATLIDTWAATASGAFALSENTLYTVEAFDDYYAHLSDRGVLSMTRWWAASGSPETIRLVVLAAGALERRGVAPADTLKHMILVKKGSLCTLLVKPTGFSPDESTRLGALARSLGYAVVLSQQESSDKTLAQMVNAGAWSKTVRDYPGNILPPTDDHPFFFYFVKPSKMWSWKHLTDKNLANPALWLLVALGGLLILLTLIFIFAPLLLRWKDLRGGGPGAGGRRALGLGYFAAIGFAFMVVEIALMQRLSLFLGHPSYSLIVVLFAILVGTALGARWSNRLTLKNGLTPLAAGGAIAVLALIAAFTLAGVLHSLITWPLPARMILSALVVLVFGVVMGIMLPLGIRQLSERDAAVIPWAWGINGGTSVIGTVAATVIAINVGFTITFVVGAGLYLLAGALGLLSARRGRQTLTL
jgi:hypothetical protein